MLVLNIYILEFDFVSTVRCHVEDFVLHISSLCYINSTNSYVRIYKQFIQNKPNFPRFSTEIDDFTKKQTQYKPNSNPNKPNICLKIRVAKPIQTQFKPNSKPISLYHWLYFLFIITTKYLRI